MPQRDSHDKSRRIESAIRKLSPEHRQVIQLGWVRAALTRLRDELGGGARSEICRQGMRRARELARATSSLARVRSNPKKTRGGAFAVRKLRVCEVIVSTSASSLSPAGPGDVHPE